MEQIRINGLSFRYPLADGPALKDVSFSVQESEFIVICGRSGSGKSTLLRHLKKNLMPYGERTGEIFFRGENLESLDDRVSTSKIGYVQQNPDNQIVTDKVWHELAFGLESLGADPGTIRRRVAEMASFFNIQSWFRKNVNELSGGQKQLLNLASIMVMQPDLLVLDEPTAQLDPVAAAEFIRTVHRINREMGTTVIISEHRLEDLFPVADRVMILEEGKIFSFQAPQQTGKLLAESRNPMIHGLPSVMRIFLETDGDAKCPMTVREGRFRLAELLGEGKPAGTEKKEMDSGGESIADFKDIRFRYSRKAEDVLRDFSLSVRKGEWYSIVGGNGTGKSTALKILSGILRPQSGRVETKGSISMVPQNPQALFTEITVEEELLEAFALVKMSDEEKISRVSNMISEMQLPGLEKAHPYDLSGGEQQRLAIGKILLLEPDLLILDEPTKGLDPFFKKTLAEILQRYMGAGGSLLMVSHDLEFCAEYSDRCGMLFDGSIVCEDVPERFFSGNAFYTTAANRMAGRWFPQAVTAEEVAECIKKAI